MHENRKKEVGVEIPIYSGADEKLPKQGKIVISVKNAHSFENKYVNLANEKYDFHPNLQNGSCGYEDHPVFLHVVKQEKNGWGQIGKGKWGDSGWIKVKMTPLDQYGSLGFGRLDNVKFSFEDNGMVRVKGTDLSRSEAKLVEPGDEGPRRRLSLVLRKISYGMIRENLSQLTLAVMDVKDE